MDDLTLRTTFDREAARYHRVRPTPPEALIDAMLGRGGLEPGMRVLKVGCGTGQATLAVIIDKHGGQVERLYESVLLSAFKHG